MGGLETLLQTSFFSVFTATNLTLNLDESSKPHGRGARLSFGS